MLFLQCKVFFEANISDSVFFLQESLYINFLQSFFFSFLFYKKGRVVEIRIQTILVFIWCWRNFKSEVEPSTFINLISR